MKSKIKVHLLVIIANIVLLPNIFSKNLPTPDINGIYWGYETNGVKAGLQIQYVSNPTNPSNSPIVICYPYLINNKTNNENWNSIHLLLWLPSIENSYQMSLFDENNNPVLKTIKGRKLGRPIDKPLKVKNGINFRAGYQAVYLDCGKSSQVRPFVLQDYFRIKKTGECHLKFGMRVIWIPKGYTNSLIKTMPPTIELPPVEAQIKLSVPTKN